jgi:hypothetical protein
MALTTTTLAAACGVNDTKISVTSATGFAPQRLIQIDGEILAQSGAGSSGTTISVRRGVEGTTPSAHAIRATVATGTGADFAAPPPGEILVPALGGAGLLHQQMTTIPHAQILTLPTTGVIVVSAPGVNRLVVPLQALCDLNTQAGVYAAAVESSWTLQTTSRWDLSSPHPVRNFLQQVNRTLFVMTCPLMDVGEPATPSATWSFQAYGDTQWMDGEGPNEAVILKDNWEGVANYTGGHASNSLTITVLYLVYDTVVKAYV